MNKRIITIAAAGIVGAAALGACTGTSEREQRKAEQAQSVIQGESLESRNLKERLKRQEDANKVGYVYLVNFGKPFGYYVVKGKVSSSGSQLGPEQDIINHSGNPAVVDSKQDDGTYGSGDPGVFFFLADGSMVETTLDYIYSDQPGAFPDVPKLGG